MGKASASSTATVKLAGVIVLLAGVLMLFGCLRLAIRDITIVREYDEKEAVIRMMSVIDGKGSHGIRAVACYEYNVEGFFYRPYSAVLPFYFRYILHEGDTIDVYIDPFDHDNAYAKTPAVVYIALIVTGALLTFAGIMLLGGRDIIRRRLVVKGRGEPVYATVTSLGDTGKLIKGKPTYRIKATWEDLSGARHDYRSEYLYFDPSLYIEKGALIRVYVDPKNYRKYYMCAKELQEQTKGE